MRRSTLRFIPLLLLVLLCATSSCGDSLPSPDGGSDGPVTGQEMGGNDGGGQACLPADGDLSAMGMDCTGDGDCPAGYTCQGFSGVVFEQSCAIRCESCDCPGGTVCGENGDKGGTWMQCFGTR